MPILQKDNNEDAAGADTGNVTDDTNSDTEADSGSNETDTSNPDDTGTGTPSPSAELQSITGRIT